LHAGASFREILATIRSAGFAVKLARHAADRHPMNADGQDLQPPPAPLFRRLAALVYDGLLLLAVLFLGTLALLPFTGGEAITPQDSGAWEYAYRGWVALLALGFFGASWTRRGQTLGMMSWKIRLLKDDGRLPGWRDVAIRLLSGAILLLCAVLGLVALARPEALRLGQSGIVLLLPPAANYLWMIFDGASRSLQDRLTGCRVVRTG
jgi:uncharacterized RDD family membrane protein YckC